MKLLRDHPVSSYGALGAALWTLVVLTGVQYDDGGVSSLLWWAAQVFALPFWLVGEAIFFFNAEGVALQTPIVVIGGLALCVVADLIIRRVRKA